MPATTRGTTGLVFAFTSAETGGLLQNLKRKNSIKTKTVPNEGGETVGVSLYDRTEEWSFEWYVATSATSGLAGIDPGETLTLVNATAASGVINATEVNTEESNEDFRKKTCTAMVWPLITS